MNFLTDLSEYLEGLELDRLHKFLQQQDAPAFESELLREFCPELNLINGPAIELYRRHFALFHQLYRLKDSLYPQGQHLHIHFMAINLCRFPDQGFCRHYCGEQHIFCEAEVDDANQMLCRFHWKASEETALTELSERYFYLDSANFSALRPEDAEAFVAGAWNLLLNQKEVDECYRILGMPLNSDLKLVKLHFRKLAKEFHPDLNPQFSDEFSRLNSAYRRLLDFLTVKRF